MASDTSKRMRLRAEDNDDLSALSALCQDMICTPSQIRFDAAAKRFVIIANRYCWEHETRKRGFFSPRPKPMRAQSALRFNYVSDVKVRGRVAQEDDLPLNMLAIVSNAAEDGAMDVRIAFSQDITFALTCEVIDATLDDLSEPWPVASRPKHTV